VIAALTEALRNSRHIEAHRPWPRVVVEENIWRDIATQLGDDLTLAGFWGEAQAVHMALLDRTSPEAIVVSLECTSRRFPSVAQFHAPAIRLERTIHDLFGLIPEASPDTRPWLDHGRWGTRYPLSHRPIDSETPQAYEFLPSDGESLHQIPVGPVHAGIIEPGHFRFTANGETVVRLEERLGYVHKGIEPLMAGAELTRAAQLAGRTSGDSTVAYALAFARAAEAALQIAAPPRAIWLRALMAELERLANHFGDIGAICNDAAFALMHAHCGVLRERVLRASETAFGHRLMRDRIIPGGVSADLSTGGIAILRALVIEARERFPRLVKLYDNTTSLQDRTVATGILRPELAARFGAGGYVGRASGRAFDARRKPGYAPYGELNFAVPARSEGDVNARVWIRIDEVEQSLRLIEQILERLPAGPIAGGLPGAVRHTPCEGLALVEGFRGDILVWLRLDRTGRVLRCHLRDPSWFQWPLLEAVIEGNIVADFPICNKSFNCSYSGHDL
jgi:Ni,Fe-hydrogenase III large subunit/Ni,Fe-hydrogenase III component G